MMRLISLILIGVTGILADCNNFTDADSLPTDQFVSILTDPCRYDKLALPNNSTHVTVQINLNHLESSLTQFTAYFTMQFGYIDEKLNYSKLSPQRKTLIGENFLENRIWTPNIYIKDGGDTTVIKSENSNVLISINPDGHVIYSYKMKTTFYCYLNLTKFPFDSQSCSLTLSDWMYTVDDLILSWKNFSVASNLHFTEFVLDHYHIDSSIANRSFFDNAYFSELTIHLKFYRQIGYYMLDFYIPSIFLVCTAWVTFWLQADAGPPRATLGASTVIAFITLHLGLVKDLPKVSYTKASDVWFLVIAFFIFTSLAEFAFVNVIWRRHKLVELKKRKSKYMFKCAVIPRIARNDLKKITGSTNSISSNCEQYDDGVYRKMNGSTDTNITMPYQDCESPTSSQLNLITITPCELAIWVDRKARIIFPVAFLIFNIFYWCFVYLY